MIHDNDYQRIESQIASDASPVGIDAKKTHVIIISKLESIEQRLTALESNAASSLPPTVAANANNALAALTDTFDDTAQRLADRGVRIDDRAHHTLDLLEQLTRPEILDALSRIVDRVEKLEPLTEIATQGPNAIAAITDTLDEEVARCAQRGIDIDAALRNGLAAVLYLGQRVTTSELESLGTLLRSDVLHPNAVDVVGRLGCALVAASKAPSGSVGPLGALPKLSNSDAKRSTAFLLEFAKQFGAALNGQGASCPTPINGAHTHG